MQPHRAIYEKLLQIIPDLPTHIAQGKYYGESKSEGFMDLHFDYAGKDEKGNPIIALSHYFEQNGDMVPDPDMEIRIVLEAKMAEALSFQNQFIYQRVYEQSDGRTHVHPKLKRDLNEFLDSWLTNIIDQGHCIDLGEKRNTQEKKMTREIKEFRQEKRNTDKHRGMER
jgi:hypothetical protein